MKRQKAQLNKGFTLVEIVIVIMVIAILAGVMLPNYASVTRKVHINSDKHQVDTMNLALENYEEEYGAPVNVKEAMNVLVSAGLDDDWTSSEDDIKMYWCSAENRMVLVDFSTEEEGELIYPEDMDTELWKGSANSRGAFRSYDQDNLEAEAVDFTASGTSTNFSDSINGVPIADVIKALVKDCPDSITPIGKEVISIPAEEGSELRACAKATSYRIDGSLQGTPQLIYISIVKADDFNSANDAGALSEAQKSAAWILYCILHQIETGTLPSDIVIVLESGITLDADGMEWNPLPTVKFTGYLGTYTVYNNDGTSVNQDFEAAEIINVSLTSATLAEELAGGLSDDKSYKYAFAGFIGNIGGGATIENLSFLNLNLDEPGQDDFAPNNESGAKNSRNCIGLIGSVSGSATLKNITVSASTYKGLSVVGGLVGFVGNCSGDVLENGYLTIDGCNVDANLVSGDYLSDENCGCVGGLVGLIDGCRSTDDNTDGATATAFETIIMNSSFSGSTTTFRRTSGAVGYLASGKLTFASENDFSEASLDVKHSASKKAGLLITEDIDRVQFKCVCKWNSEGNAYEQPVKFSESLDPIIDAAGRSYVLGTTELSGTVCEEFTYDLSEKVACGRWTTAISYNENGEESSRTDYHGWIKLVHGISVETASGDSYRNIIKNGEEIVTVSGDSSTLIINYNDDYEIISLWNQSLNNNVGAWAYEDTAKAYSFYHDCTNLYEGQVEDYKEWYITLGTDSKYGNWNRGQLVRYAYGDSDASETTWKYTSTDRVTTIELKGSQE